MLESCNQRNGLSGMTSRHHFWWAFLLLSAFSPTFLSPPIAMFPSPVISSFGTNSRCSSRSAPAGWFTGQPLLGLAAPDASGFNYPSCQRVLIEYPGEHYLQCSFNPSFSDFALLLPIVVYRYDVEFVGMVLPGDELSVKRRHIGMRDGNIVVNIETVRR